MKRPFATLVLTTLATVAGGPEGIRAQAATPSPSPGDFRDAYRVFTGTGEPASLADVVEAMRTAEVVMVGEIHTDPVGHWIESELLRSAIAIGGEGAGGDRPVALSLEMFERDVQGVVDEYLAGLITEDQFRASSRPWPHYEADYRRMVETAKTAGIPVLAANAPRRYVNRVSRLGPAALADLTTEALRTLPPLPFPPPTEAYRAEWNALMSGMTMADQCPSLTPEASDNPHAATPPPSPPAHAPPPAAPTHGGLFMENGLQAQTLWDAAMAHTITSFLDRRPRALVLHVVGGFHVQNFTGIPEKVEFYRPGTRSLVVHMDTAEDIGAFDPAEHAGRGDFVILTDAGLDLNYDRNCRGGAPRG